MALEELDRDSLIAEVKQMREDYKMASDALSAKKKQVEMIEEKLEGYQEAREMNKRLIRIIETQSESLRNQINTYH